MESTCTRLTIARGVATVMLDRPAARNSFNMDLATEMLAAIREVEISPDVRAVVVTGNGHTFSAGVDIKFLQHSLASGHPEAASKLGELFNRTLIAIDRLTVPTIAVVEGHAVGGGFELMLSCDMAICADSAAIGDGHMKQNIVGHLSLWQMPRVIGLRRAMELGLTGRVLSGKEAQECGLVLRSVPADRLGAELESLLAQLRDKSLPALRLAKRMMKGAVAIASGEEALHYIDTEKAQDTAAWKDMEAGMKTFVDKGKAQG